MELLLILAALTLGTAVSAFLVHPIMVIAYRRLER